MTDFKCLNCGVILKSKDLRNDILIRQKQKSMFASVGIKCLKCGTEGAENFVCANCGRLHGWRPWKCRR